MNVLLTGGTGFLGQRVASVLIRHGHRVRLLVRKHPPGGLSAGTEPVVGDVVDHESFRRAAEGCDAIIHMAALVKMWVPDPKRFHDVNVSGLQHAIDLARAKALRLIYTSSFLALGSTGPEPVDENRPPLPRRFHNPYERTKAAADQIARTAAAAGQDVVVLYPGVVYGPGALTEGNLVGRLLRDHRERRLPGIVGPGDRLWSYAFIDDVAEAHASALERAPAGERYILGGENATLNALFATLQRITGLPPPRRHIPYAAAWLSGFSLFLWAEMTGAEPQLTHQVVNVFREHWAFSSAKAERELAYVARPLEDGLRRTVPSP